ncbi:kappa-type opioid receptor-like [Saccostrea cucullata]|uniref:kappa-type opioid receptor-like n=1 Tax=Saccostrea cuccullata TaxID=36930 RepID=UPI002ED33D19
MASANTTTTEPPLSSKLVVFITLQQVVFVLACVGNIFVIIIFVKYLKLKTATNKFVVNMSIADLFTGFTSGIQVLYFLIISLNTNMALCFLRYQILSLVTITSQLLVTFTTFDRFVAICLPHHYKNLMTKRVSNILVIVAWLFGALLFLIPFAGAHHWDSGILCMYHVLFHRSVYLITGFSMFIFMAISVVLYCFILHKAWKYQTRIRPGNSLNVERQKKIEKDIRSARIMAIVTVAFSICWAPYTVFQIRYGFGIIDIELYSLSNWLVFLGISNSIMNPFIYAWQRNDFRQKWFRLMPCLGKNLNGRDTSMTQNVSSIAS